MDAVLIHVLNHNTREALHATLTKLVEVDRERPVEVVVSDNASTDGSVDMVARDFTGFRLVTNRENLGFGRAHNQVLLESGAARALILNSDAEISVEALDLLGEYLDADPDAAAAAPRVRYPDGTTQVSTGAEPTVFEKTIRMTRLDDLVRSPRLRRFLGRFIRRGAIGGYLGNYRPDTGPRTVDWAMGSCLLLRLDAFREIGGFDERIFLYYEDADLCRRLRADGWRIVQIPEAEICHRHRETERVNPEVIRAIFIERYRSMFYYFSIHRGRTAVSVLRGVALVTSLVGWAVSLIRWAGTSLPGTSPSGRHRDHMRAHAGVIALAIGGDYPRPGEGGPSEDE
jgi:GT2 family glycosyltransferase